MTTRIDRESLDTPAPQHEQTMQLLNEVGLDTARGFRTIQLYEGDLMQMGRYVDVLVLSAFANSYYPARGSVIAGIRDAFGLHVLQLLKDAQLDFRASLGVWVSDPLHGVPFGRIVGVELDARTVDIGDTIGNIFAAIGLLEAKGVATKSIALPLLGSGVQGLTPGTILPHLIPAVSRALDRLDNIERVYFVERNASRARAISDAIDTTLHRTSVRLGGNEVFASVRRELVSSLQTHGFRVPRGHEALPGELREGLSNESPRSIEIGILGRRLVEFVVNEIAPASRPSSPLDHRIESLASVGVAPWMRSYMHVLRVLGNEQAHQQNAENRQPPCVVAQDLAVSLFCMLRVWEYWADREIRRSEHQPVTPRR